MFFRLRNFITLCEESCLHANCGVVKFVLGNWHTCSNGSIVPYNPV
jgi:hypothetical protein